LIRNLSVPLCALVLAAPLTAQQLPSMPAPVQRFVPQNLTLSYAVDWRVFPAGTASFHLMRDGNTERVSASGDSVGAVSLLYKVVDRFQSSFDRRAGCSLDFDKQLQEGRRQVNSTLRFDYGKKKQIFHEKNLVKGTVRNQEAPVPACVSDLMSAIFVGGEQNLEPGRDYSLPIADAMRVIAVTFKPEAREDVTTQAGTFRTIRVEPTADAGVVKNRGNIWIWYTDDDRHLPVQMRARLFWGTLTLRLTSLEQK
jgi:hypothetical protein